MARRLAPNRTPWTDARTFPSNNKFFRSVNADRSGLSSGAPSRKSLMYRGLKLSDPPAEPFGNYWMAVKTAELACRTLMEQDVYRLELEDVDITAQQTIDCCCSRFNQCHNKHLNKSFRTSSVAARNA
jgi:hypothetical protein